MSGALPSLPSAHDMAASSVGAGAHGRGLARAVLTMLTVPAPRVKGRGRARSISVTLYRFGSVRPERHEGIGVGA